MRIAKVRDVKTPSVGTPGSAGIDFYVPNDLEEVVNIRPGKSALIPSGIKVEIPDNTALIAFNKSSVASKRGMIVGACVIDSDYQGEIYIHLINVSNDVRTISPGDKIVQFVHIPYYKHDVIVEVSPESLSTKQSSRGSGGFGSTGSK